jgi:hypothetical protein
MGRRYLLSGRVQIVLRTGGGKHTTKNILKRSGYSVSVPQMWGRCPRNAKAVAKLPTTSLAWTRNDLSLGEF